MAWYLWATSLLVHPWALFNRKASIAEIWSLALRILVATVALPVFVVIILFALALLVVVVVLIYGLIHRLFA